MLTAKAEQNVKAVECRTPTGLCLCPSSNVLRTHNHKNGCLYPVSSAPTWDHNHRLNSNSSTATAFSVGETGAGFNIFHFSIFTAKVYSFLYFLPWVHIVATQT